MNQRNALNNPSEAVALKEVAASSNKLNIKPENIFSAAGEMNKRSFKDK